MRWTMASRIPKAKFAMNGSFPAPPSTRSSGLVILEATPGQKREKRIYLTEKGKEYARQTLRQVYEAEEEALRETLKTCSASFVADFEIFAANIKAAFDKHMPD